MGSPVAGEGAMIDHLHRHARGGGMGQSAGFGPVRDHYSDAVGAAARARGREDRRQIGAAARDQDGDRNRFRAHP